ncbi:hypothetical protein C823_004141 [Eubacterium plexicaudatum ASF492]|uniref:Uncharacterized protein n=1 Tax=Eubacterium plexicaudatum ASF492 TaxID=1235802 RepID=N1ZLE7_9FIRM|nr:hypothetical protein C823_004141 [Eubacterium plexicaudatum ASF492]
MIRLKRKNPRKFWTYEMEIMLMTEDMKNVFCISSMQKMTDERCGGGGIMTIQQKATNLIYCLPDENVKLIVDVMRKMLTPVIEGTEKNKSLDTSKRIGLGKGIINGPEGFDVWNSEISDLFEGTDI